MTILKTPKVAGAILGAFVVTLVGYVTYILAFPTVFPLTKAIQTQEEICVLAERAEECAIAGRAYKYGKSYRVDCSYTRWSYNSMCRRELVEIDTTKAQTYLEKACNADHQGACAQLAELYLEAELGSSFCYPAFVTSGFFTSLNPARRSSSIL